MRGVSPRCLQKLVGRLPLPPERVSSDWVKKKKRKARLYFLLSYFLLHFPLPPPPPSCLTAEDLSYVSKSAENVQIELPDSLSTLPVLLASGRSDGSLSHRIWQRFTRVPYRQTVLVGHGREKSNSSGKKRNEIPNRNTATLNTVTIALSPSFSGCRSTLTAAGSREETQ